MDKILLFIPMYNCQSQIYRVLEKVSKSSVYDLVTEIIVIDNHSKDDSLQIAQQAINKFQMTKCLLTQNIQNVGLGGSHKSAFKYAELHGFDYLIVLHGDDQGNINDFAQIIVNKLYQKYDAILGSRFSKGSRTVGYSKFRIFGNHVFNTLISIICFKTINDLGSGLNMYKVSSLKYSITFPDNLIFNVFMLMAHVSYGQRIVFLPITWTEEDQVSNVKMFSQTLEMSKYLLKYFVYRKSFLNKEHRINSNSEYEFNIIYRLES
ncbi:glycosyltransferase family 2 protein [Paenibacillus aestuarii]|uniref:Glycosyltransferase family 2 protein n=1 Tax=Paenibacillus aestuarii TaxID=516965 RepID=A0ABW0K1C7_9BACL|nr:glycosyltransferase family 2 protein [Paenibacillus aestuarii]